LSNNRPPNESLGRGEWSDDPLFWRAMEPALCAPSRLSAADGDVEAILSFVDLSPNAAVLDLGSGPGAHAVAFARRGYRVTGVDTSRRLLDRARTAARREGVQVEWVEADMREFRRAGTFDLVCSLYASFGYFDDRQNRQVLENVRTSLKPGGWLVLDLVGRETVVHHWVEQRRHEVEHVLYIERRRLVDGGSSMVSDWIVVREGNRLDFRMQQRLYSGTELQDLLLSVGFAEVHLAGSLDGQTPYDASARRLVAVARTPAGSP
jgi:SAM-dependent methyltransferase